MNCIHPLFVERLLPVADAHHGIAAVLELNVSSTLKIGLDMRVDGSLVPHYRMCGAEATFPVWFHQFKKETAQ